MSNGSLVKTIDSGGVVLSGGKVREVGIVGFQGRRAGGILCVSEQI